MQMKRQLLVFAVLVACGSAPAETSSSTTPPAQRSAPSPGSMNAGGAGSDDRDGDGVLSQNDRCPDAAEDRDAFEDEDGCPEPDNDQDRILDQDDRCPNEPELYNGLYDDDGCPDASRSDLPSS